MKNILSLFIATLALVAVAVPSRAQVLLQLDFGPSSAPVQAGFQDFNGSTTSYTPINLGFTTGSVSVSQTGAGLVLNRGTGPGSAGTTLTGAYAALYQDWIGVPLTTVSLSGLNNSTLYTITFQDYDIEDGAPSNSMTVTDSTVGGLGNSAIATYSENYDPSASLGVSLGETPATLSFQSSATGTATFSFSSTSNGVRVNGFELNAVSAPEPSTYVMLGAGCLFLAWQRRTKTV